MNKEQDAACVFVFGWCRVPVPFARLLPADSDQIIRKRNGEKWRTEKKKRVQGKLKPCAGAGAETRG